MKSTSKYSGLQGKLDTGIKNFVDNFKDRDRFVRALAVDMRINDATYRLTSRWVHSLFFKEMDDDGFVDGRTREDLARSFGVSLSKMVRCITLLEQTGWLVRRSTQGRYRNGYQFTFPQNVEVEHEDELHASNGVKSDMVANPVKSETVSPADTPNKSVSNTTYSVDRLVSNNRNQPDLCTDVSDSKAVTSVTAATEANTIVASPPIGGRDEASAPDTGKSMAAFRDAWNREAALQEKALEALARAGAHLKPLSDGRQPVRSDRWFAECRSVGLFEGDHQTAQAAFTALRRRLQAMGSVQLYERNYWWAERPVRSERKAPCKAA